MSQADRTMGTYPDLPPGLPDEYVRIFEAAEPLLQTRLNDLHAKIGAQIVVELLRRDGGDLRIALPAILLHDLGWSEVPVGLRRSAFGPGSSNAELNRQHELAGVRLAGRLLEGVGYPSDLTTEILRIIDGHDSRPRSETLEEAIVKDADKMWRITKLGFPASLQILETLSPQELHDFVAVRAPSWFLAPSSLEMVREQLDARREEYTLDPAPEIPPPSDFGVGDAVALEVKGAANGTKRDTRGEQMIAAIVQFGLPQPITRDQAREIFSSSAPKYRTVPGLLRKYYVLSTDGRTAGGMYLWQSREVADRFYSDDWKEGVRVKYGTEPSVTYFECPVVVDNVAHETIIDD